MLPQTYEIGGRGAIQRFQSYAPIANSHKPIEWKLNSNLSHSFQVIWMKLATHYLSEIKICMTYFCEAHLRGFWGMPLLYTRLKKRDLLWEHMRQAGSVQSICLLNNLNSFYCIIIKLCDIVCWHNLSATFNNQPDLMEHLWPLFSRNCPYWYCALNGSS